MGQLEEAEVVEPGEAAPVDLDAALSAAFDKATQARDEGGRFAAKQDTPEPAPAAVPAPSEQAPAPAQEIKAPASWPKEDQERFKALPPEIQQVVLAREQDRERYVNTKAQEAAEARKSLAAIEQITAPYKALIEAEGGNYQTVVQNMLHTAAMLRQNPAQAIQALAQRYGVALGGAPNPSSAADPRLMSLEQRLQRFELAQAQEREAAQQRQKAALDATIREFAEQKEGDTLKHPHFEKVRVRMGVLMQAGDASDLEDAYQKAVWADPEIRASLIEQQQKAAEAARLEEQRKAADAAKKAAGTRVKPRDGLPVSEGKKSLDQLLSETYDRATAT